MSQRQFSIKRMLALLIALTLIGGGLSIPRLARAATLTVTNTNDSGPGSLRQAIADAASGDTVNFQLTGCPCVIKLTSGPLVVNKNLFIQGPGANVLTVDGQQNTLHIFMLGTVTSPFVTISGLTIQGGNATAPDYVGGGIYLIGGSGTLDSVYVTGNIAVNGGGVYAGNPITITNTTIANNTATSSGGGIYSLVGLMHIINSTLYGNYAGREGGAIYLDRFSMGNKLTNSTVYGNSSGYAVGGIDTPGHELSFGSSIIAGNIAAQGDPDLRVGTPYSLGNNLIGKSSDIGYPDTDQVGTLANPLDPKLNALALNAPGTTQTMSLQPGSPAIGKGNCATLIGVAPITTDQRGVTRKTPCDVGAYETAGIITPTATSTTTPTRTSTATPTPPRPDTIGVFSNGVFYLKNSNTTGYADITIPFGAAGNLPIVGDWNGDGVDTIGVYVVDLGVFLLRDSNTSGNPDHAFVMGNPGDEPIAGKWDASMTHDGIGVYRPSNGLLFGKQQLTNGYADYTMVLGNPGDHGIAGDWDGNGYDSIGVYRPSDTRFYLANQMGGTTSLPAIIYDDYHFDVAPSWLTPIAGDWTGSGVSRVGFVVNGIFNLKNSFTNGGGDTVFAYGLPGALPIAGKWTNGGAAPAPNVIVPIRTSVPPSRVVPTRTPDSGIGQFD